MSWREIKTYTHIKTCMQVFIIILFIKTCIQTFIAELLIKTCIAMFTAVLFIMTKSGNNPNIYQLVVELKKIRHICAIKYYSAIKKVLMRYWYRLHTTWMVLKKIMLNERSLMQKTIFYMIPSTWNIHKRQVYRRRK